MNNKKNFLSALIYQIVHIIYGFLIPKLILETFGSDINGLVSSITQFLSFISLFEGGLGAVVLAELYSPIEENNHERIKNLMISCQQFFGKIGMLFIGYTAILSGIYSFSFREKYNISFIVALVFVLSLTTLAQYLFSITYRLYLQASQKIYVTNYLNTVILFVNTIIAIVVIKCFPDVIVLKLLSSIAFFVQPIIYQFFIPKEYIRTKKGIYSKVPLKNRWSGFAQNLAHYVNMNTDIVLITIFCTFTDVSIYSVYLLGVNAIRSVISNIANSYQSALGLYIARKDKKLLESKFKEFCIFTCGVSLCLFCTCLLVVNQFVSVYTKNLSDGNYYQPYFAAVIILANLIYCIREPFRLLILASGQFKETNFGSIMEAVINLGLSLMLIKSLGLLGIAIGTFVAILYRMIYFVIFLKKKTINLNSNEYIKYIHRGMCIITVNIVLYGLVRYNVDSFGEFFAYTFAVLFVESIVSCLFFIGPKQSGSAIKNIVNVKNKS